MPEKLTSGLAVNSDLSKACSPLTRGVNKVKRSAIAPYAGTFPAPGATLDLDFANNRGYVRGLGQGGVMDGITFTRASNATYMGQDGVFRSYSDKGALGKNLWTFPQNPELWSFPSQISVTPNAIIAPDGTRTGARIEILENASRAVSRAINSITLPFVYSVYVKKGSAATNLNVFGLYNATTLKDVVFANINYDTKQISYSVGSSGISVQDVGDGWLRVSVTPSNGFSNGDTALTYFGSSGQSNLMGKYFFMWGAQVEFGTSTATTYYPTNYNSPRLDYQATQIPVRNLLTYTESFDNSYWGKNTNGISSNLSLSPVGSLSADKFIPTTSITQQWVYKTGFSVVNNTNYCFSCYIKAGEYRYAQLRIITESSTKTVASYGFDTLTGTVYSSFIGTGSISNAGNGWYRCYVVGTTTSSDASVYINVNNTNALTTSFSGNGIDGIYIWGAQLELGSTVTPYQPIYGTQPTSGYLPNVTQKNLLSYTDDFSNAAWTKISTTITTNANTAPDGTTTADKLSATGSNSFVRQDFQAYKGLTYTFSFWMKAVSSDVVFNLYLYNVGLAGTFAASSNIKANSTWQRVSVTGTSLSDQLASALIGGALTFTTGEEIYVWGAQVEVGPMTDYSPVLNSTMTSSALVPTTTGNGILIEESRTNRCLWNRDASQTPNRNLLKYSENFTNGVWEKLNGGSGSLPQVTSNYGIAPDSTLTADRVILSLNGGTTVNDYSWIQQGNTFNGPKTFSIYLKSLSGNCVVSLIEATFSAQRVEVTVTEDWQRFNYSPPVGTSYIAVGFRLRGNHGTSDYADLLVWGAQLDYANTSSTYEPTYSGEYAIWSKQGLTATKDQTGIDGVATSCTRLTADSNNATLIQTYTATQTPYTSSIYLKRITGTGNVKITMDGSNYSYTDLSVSEWRRYALTANIANPCLGITLENSGDEVAVDFGQIEAGTFQTSPILTTSAAVSRSADVASVLVNNRWFNPQQFTVRAEYITPLWNFPPSITLSGIILANDTSTRLLYVVGSGMSYFAAINDGLLKTAQNSVLQLFPAISVSSYGNGKTVCTAGSLADKTSAITPNAFVRASVLYIGLLSSGSTFLNSTIKRLVYFPKQVSDDAVKTLST